MGGGAVAAATTMAAGDREPVLTVVRPVDAGTAIQPRDLGEARIAADPQLDPIPADQRDRVVGQIAGVDLRPGTLLTDSQLDAVAIPGPGQALVGVALTPGRRPARALQHGDRVLAVITAADTEAGGTAPAGADPLVSRASGGRVHRVASHRRDPRGRSARRRGRRRRAGRRLRGEQGHPRAAAASQVMQP